MATNLVGTENQNEQITENGGRPLNTPAPGPGRFHLGWPALRADQHVGDVQRERPNVTIRPRLDYLDGIRAFAALYVLVTHCSQFAGWFGHVPSDPVSGLLSVWLVDCQVAVQAFIWLSGIVLMLPVLRAGTTIKGGIATFYKRRALRILPAYYLTMAICLFLIVVTPFGIPNGTVWDLSCQVNWTNVIAHLFLVQNWVGDKYSIDSPMWSLAIECQIYFIFPLIVWAWRRIGGVAVFLIVMALKEFPGPQQLFLVYLLCFVGGGLCAQYAPRLGEMLIAADNRFVGALRGFFGSAPLVKIGSFSYSLYLIHVPILAGLWTMGIHSFYALVAVGLPVSLAAAYGFGRAAETPFMSSVAARRHERLPTPT